MNVCSDNHISVTSIGHVLSLSHWIYDHEKWIDRNNKITQINDACKPLPSTNKHHIYNGWRDFSIINTQLSKKTLSIQNLIYQNSTFVDELRIFDNF